MSTVKRWIAIASTLVLSAMAAIYNLNNVYGVNRYVYKLGYVVLALYILMWGSFVFFMRKDKLCMLYSIVLCWGTIFGAISSLISFNTNADAATWTSTAFASFLWPMYTIPVMPSGIMSVLQYICSATFVALWGFFSVFFYYKYNENDEKSTAPKTKLYDSKRLLFVLLTTFLLIFCTVDKYYLGEAGEVVNNIFTYVYLISWVLLLFFMRKDFYTMVYSSFVSCFTVVSVFMNLAKIDIPVRCRPVHTMLFCFGSQFDGFCGMELYKKKYELQTLLLVVVLVIALIWAGVSVFLAIKERKGSKLKMLSHYNSAA